MSTQIYYFSGTGNSLYVARELQRRIPDTVLVPMIGALKSGPVASSGAAVGLVFPVHAFTVPLAVKQFLRQVDLRSAQYLFAVATRGGSPCPVFRDVDRLLRPQKKSLDAYFYLEMPGNFLLLHFKALSPETQRQMDRELQPRLDAMRDVIENRRISREPDRRAQKAFFRRHVQQPALKWVAQTTRYGLLERAFYADARCSGCGLCGQVCPAGKIALPNGKPEWRRDVPCLFCFGCINYCPAQAIQIRNTKTAECGRYHHFAVDPRDIAEQKKPV